MIRRDRSGLALIALLGLGLIAAAYALWVQGAQISANQHLIRQQQRALDAVLSRAETDRAQTEQLRSLVAALQAQVRQLGGTPLTQAPTPSTRPAPRAQTPAAAPTTPRRPATRSPAPSPRPSTSPRAPSSPAPSPSPTPARICVGPVCLPGGS